MLAHPSPDKVFARHRRPATRVLSPFLAALIGTALVVTAPATGVAQADTPLTRGAPPNTPGHTSEAQSALALARLSGQPVDVVSERSETTRTVANPDGTFTSEVYARPQWTRRHGDWVPVDTTLQVNADGSVSPAAAVVDLRLSGGGSGPLVTMEAQGRRIGLTWPGPLPKPTLSGDTATYAEVLPGVDLRVTAEVDGYREVLVVKHRAAAANPALRQIRFGLLADGVRAAVDRDGRLVATDDAGEVVFAGDAPMMWDNPTLPVGLSADAIAALPELPGPARHTVMPAHLDEAGLTITPDSSILDDPQANYPIFIDPSSSTVTSYDWTHINKTYPSQSYWSYDRSDGAKVGYSNWSSPTVTYRSFFLFSFSGWQGRTVTGATFQITLDHSASCGDTPVDLYRTRNISRSSAVTWDNSSGSTTWLAKLSSDSGSANEGSCPAPDELMEFGNVQSSVQTAVNAGGQLTLGLRAPNEGDRYQWKKFHPTSAKLVVNWNVPANVPSSLSTVPPTPCGTSTNPTPLNTATPTFTARLSDPYHDNVFGTLEIRENGALVHSVNTATVVSGATVAWPAIPAGKLPVDQPTRVFSYEARASDGSLASGWTARCYFTIDRQVPGTPTVTSLDFPNGEAMLPVGQLGTVTFSPGYGPTGVPDTDIAGYRYGFQQDKLTGWVTADSTGHATVPVVLWSTARTLYVQAVDRAGNVSVSEEPCLCTSWELRAADSGAAPAHEPGDVNGDGLADVSTLFDLGYGRTAAWTLTSRAGGGFHQPYLGWDSGINGGFNGYRIKHVTGDFTGDGLADIAVFRDDPDRRLRLFLMRSDAHRYDAGSVPLWEGPAGSTWTLNRIQPVAIDADGDGRLDIATMVDIGTAEYTLNVFRNTTSGSTVSFASPAEWWHNPAGAAQPSRTKFVGGDFNGDGKGDMAMFYNYDNGQTKLWLYASTGSAFSGGSMKWDSGTGNWWWDNSTFVTGDFTGDGKTDIMCMYDYSAGYTRFWIFPATDSGFNSPSVWWDGQYAGSSFDASRVRLVPGDLNNDGRSDITAIYDATGATAKAHVFLAGTGSTAVAPNLAAPSWSGRIGAVPANITPEPGRHYRLIASHSDKCLDVSGASTGDGAQIIQYSCWEPGDNQKVTFVPVGDGPYYLVKFVHSGKCMDVKGAGRSNGEVIHQWTCHGNGNQQWRLEYLDGSGLDVQARIRAAHSDLCVGISGASTANQAAAVQWTCSGGPGTDHSYYVRLVP